MTSRCGPYQDLSASRVVDVCFRPCIRRDYPQGPLSEPLAVDSSIVRSEVPDDVPLPCDLVKREATQIVSHALSALEGGLAREDILALNAAD